MKRPARNKFIGHAFIIRGLPGSGKSTLANCLARKNSIAADDYFTDIRGRYQYDITKRNDAHADCFQRWVKMVQAQLPRIAVANTFTRLVYLNPYRIVAEQNGYLVQVIHAECSIETAKVRGIHSVPDAVYEQMQREWEDFQ